MKISLSDDIKTVIKISFGSRLSVFALQLLLNFLIPDHHSTDVYHDPEINSKTKSFLDSMVQDYALNGFVKWDSHYFVSIATGGYQKEEFLVFFPLFPIIISSLATALNILTFNLLNLTSCVLISSLVLNTLFFMVASVTLYKLTRDLFNSGDPLSSFHFALESVIWFCFNPSSIFFSAVYSESLFTFLTFSGLYLLEKQQFIWSSVLFGLCGLTRSNGILTVGFILHKLLSLMINGRIPRFKSIFLMMATGIISTLPFLVFQLWYMNWKYCGTGVHSKSPFRGSFCPKTGYNWIMPYSFLQEKYWNQGFMRYFQMKQIPNFLLATPIILIIGISAIRYLYINRHQLMSLGLKHSSEEDNKKSDDTKSFGTTVWFNQQIFAYFIHASFIVIFGFFFIHVQVLTRLIASSSPILYWISASQVHNSFLEKFFKFYFILYFFTGLAMFSNFLPWT